MVHWIIDEPHEDASLLDLGSEVDLLLSRTTLKVERDVGRVGVLICVNRSFYTARFAHGHLSCVSLVLNSKLLCH